LVKRRRLGLKEPETLDLGPDALLADEDDEHEEASQHIAAINEFEEHIKELDTMTGFSIVGMDHEMEIFCAPQNAKD
jgi:hypothetical protein